MRTEKPHGKEQKDADRRPGKEMMTAGIDIGGTQLRAAVFDEDCEILEVHKVANDRSLTCRENMDRILEFLKGHADRFEALGIGCPGPIDAARGNILTPPNLVGWDHFPIVDYVEERLGIRAALNNDGNVAALAEAELGSGRGCSSVVYVTISTGVGGGFIYRGEIVSGANSNAAELWNLIVSDDKHSHKNANPGSLNEQCSGSGLEMWAAEHYGKPVSAKELFEKFYAGDPGAGQIIMHGAEMMGRGLANIMCMLDPEVIVIGGSVARHNPKYVQMCTECAGKYLIAPEAMHVRMASFGDDAGLIGAGLLARKAAKNASARS